MSRAREVQSFRGSVLIVGIGYFLAAKLGEALAFPSAPVLALWAPNAILFATLLLVPVARWWCYLLVILPVHLLAQMPGTPFQQVAIQYIFNCLEAALGAAALLRIEPHPLSFHKLSTMVNLIVLGSVAAPLVTSLAVAGAFIAFAITDDFWLTAIARTITNAFTTMTLVPLIVHGANWLARPRIEWREASEALAIGTSLLIVGVIIFIQPHAQHDHGPPALLYAPIPLLLWATVRLGTVGTCGSILLVAALATWGVLDGTGPFSDRHPVENALSLMLFLNVTCATLLLLSAVVQERKETAAALVRSEGLHRAVLASLQQQIAVLDEAGCVIEVNDSWRDSRSHIQCEGKAVLPGQNYLMANVMAAEHGNPSCLAIRDALHAVLSGGSSRRELGFQVQRQGELRWFDQSIEALRRPERGAVITLSDVTARKRAELEVHEQQRQIAHLARVAILGEFAGAFAHEISQPLAAILASAEAGVLLYKAGGHAADSIHEILDEIVADSVRAGQVVERQRSMLRNAETQRLPAHLSDLAQESLLLARVDLARHGVVAAVNFEPDLPCVCCDRVQIEQVILNLIVNACQAMADVAPEAKRLTLLTRWAAKPVEVELVVCDCGLGIDDDLLERIFEPFVTTKADGLGLGLSISRSIVVTHGGKLWAENAHAGAVFHLSLPIAQQHA